MIHRRATGNLSHCSGPAKPEMRRESYQNWDLYVNGSGTPVKSGVISAFAEGKYLVFDVNGLNGGDTFRLDLGIGPVSPGCEENPTNRTVSGVFISGTSVCGFCGDGYHDPDTEACDGTDPTDTNADICNEACGYCGDGVYDPDFEQCDGSDEGSPNADSCNDMCEVILDPLGCRFTGGLNDIFITEDERENRYSAGGQAGANTALQPQPKGEWTHRQRRGPAGRFTFHGGTASSPVGSEIDVIRCSDPGGCTPSGDPPSPVKQLDFDGIGTFKNIGRKNGSRIPDFVKDGKNAVVGNGNKNYDGTLHWFEVNIDDLGEPGNTNPNKNPGDGSEACPPNGFGEKGDAALGDCSCSDFYRITIYDGVDATKVKRNADGSIDRENMNTTDVIYEVSGYIDGGNLQLHHLTGFDRK